MARAGKVDLKAQRWIPDFPDADNIAMGLLHSEEGALAGLSGSSEIDELIEQGRRESDPALRHATYREIEKILTREALIVPLFHEQTYPLRAPSDPAVCGSAYRCRRVRYDELYSEG